jgi:hypothetical protein
MAPEEMPSKTGAKTDVPAQDKHVLRVDQIWSRSVMIEYRRAQHVSLTRHQLVEKTGSSTL